jgi:hypothetical protein
VWSVRWCLFNRYQSKELMENNGIPVQRFKTAQTAGEAEKAAEWLRKFGCFWLLPRLGVATTPRPISLQTTRLRSANFHATVWSCRKRKLTSHDIATFKWRTDDSGV